ncbi:MAG: chain length determinant protein tyrosine kinase EpsG [Methylobacter sp.]|jgi:chain length determinant protein tyrosine kinase EpsG|uniref:Chain length determinant protein tyrosine kinase EpsG n=1 Tax=Methylobacter tundripaludum TaxID=173365 RepID=A0A2S6HCW4_9GAMM|nr:MULTISPECIES: chain length determinant protein tyrosine kinase EpsG [Methylobacter]MDI1277310.1 chain length determinant protein tyrosine kinase EpsG [Methylobacter sp.]MDI1357898.1 chain length determinant protein tyrosine kinase EpsG [Methylobacter sp.]PPK75290.1 chain length determinant protein tyrosine kinase EpsG [Methylobacter tundripaludum]
MDIVNIKKKSLSIHNADRRDSNIGKLLLDLGKIKPEDAERVLRLQKEEGIRFGDAAQRLGLISDADIMQVLSLQFDYPYLQLDQCAFSKDLIAAYQPFSSQVEALRALRSQLILRWFNEKNKALAVISVTPGDGGSHLAANLAVVFSQLGEKTLLIDANLREPVQHKIFNLTESRGLSDILAGRSAPDIATKIESFVDLTVLGAGTTPPNPQELLNRSNFTDFMRQAVAGYDAVIVDTAPAAETSDALAVASRCGGAILVARLNQTRLAKLKNIQDQLTISGVQIVGAVVNDF